MIELRTLGAFQVRKDGPSGPEPVTLSPKRAALLIHLAFARPPGRHGRDSLLALFWPEASADRARHALSQAIYVLRKELGAGVIRGDGDAWLELDRGQIRCDAAEFEAALETGEPERALELYAGDLLPGFFISGCPEFEHWLELERARLRELAAAAARALAERERAAGRVAPALRWLRAAAERAPYDEEIQTLLVSALRDLGDRTGALREYESFVARLAATLELSPSPTLAGLAESIRAGVEDSPASAAEPSESPAMPPIAPPATPPTATPPTATSPAATPPAAESLRLASKAADAVWSVAQEPGRWVRPLGLTALVVALVVAPALAGRHWSAAADQPVTATAADAALSPNRVLVLPFTDQRGEHDVLGRVAADWITQGLARSGLMEVVSPLSGPGMGPTANSERPSPRADRVDAAAAAAAVGAAIVVTGSYYVLDGDRILFHARIQDVMSGRVLHALDPVSGSAASPLGAVETLRQRVTGALAALLDPRLAPWAAASGSPPSLEAYTLYVQGIERYTGAPVGIGPPGPGEAVREAAAYFQRAFELDTTFTAALIWELLTGAGPRSEREAQLAGLMARRANLPPLERHLTEYLAANFRADWEAAYQAMRGANDLMPRSEWAWHLATTALWTGRPAAALNALDQLDPERSWWMRNWPLYCRFLLPALHSLGEYERALRESPRCRALYPQDPAHGYYEVHALAALGRDEEAVARAVSLLAEPAHAGFTTRWMAHAIYNLRAHGHPEASAALARHALDWLDNRLPATDRAAVSPPDLGEFLYAVGEYERARAVLLPTVDDDRPGVALESLTLLALVEARLGNREEATRLWLRVNAMQLPPNAEPRRAMNRVRMAGLLFEPDQALRVLAEAWQPGGWQRLVGAADHLPELHALRDHPGFLEMVRPRD
jgi:DNA-binding SARP family transcriptional activator